MGPTKMEDGKMVYTDPKCPYCDKKCKIDGNLMGPPIAVPWSGEGYYTDGKYSTDGD